MLGLSLLPSFSLENRFLTDYWQGLEAEPSALALPSAVTCP